MTKIAYLRASQNYTNWSSGPTASTGSSIPQVGGHPSTNILNSPTRSIPQPSPVGRFFPGAQQGLQFQTPSSVPRGGPQQRANNNNNNNIPKPMMMAPTTRFNSNPTVIFDDPSDGGRISKPLMEKRRRARINQCLSQLKTIVVDSAGQYTENNKCKLEKADILELTVKYVKMLYQNSTTAAPATSVPESTKSSPNSQNELYLNGYSDCIQQVFSYVDQELPELKESERDSLSDHLTRCLLSHRKQSTPTTATTESPKPIFCTPPSPAPSSESLLDRSSVGSNSPILSKSLENSSLTASMTQSSANYNPLSNNMVEESDSLESYNYYDDYEEDEEEEDEEEMEDEEHNLAQFQIRANLPLNLKVSAAISSQNGNRKRPRHDLGLDDDEEVWRPW